MRQPNPYDRFRPEDLILRDQLAIDRTILANERTFLAYLRTGLALMLAGVTFIHFARDTWFSTVGVLCLPVGILIMLVGVARYRSVRAKIWVARKQLKPRTPPARPPNGETGRPATPPFGK